MNTSIEIRVYRTGVQFSLVQSGGGKHALRLYPPVVVHHTVSVPVIGFLLQYRTALMNRVMVKFRNMQAVNVSFLLYRPDTKHDTLLPYTLYYSLIINNNNKEPFVLLQVATYNMHMPMSL